VEHLLNAVGGGFPGLRAEYTRQLKARVLQPSPSPCWRIKAPAGGLDLKRVSITVLLIKQLAVDHLRLERVHILLGHATTQVESDCVLVSPSVNGYVRFIWSSFQL